MTDDLFKINGACEFLKNHGKLRDIMGKPISNKKIVRIAGKPLTAEESKEKLFELLRAFDQFCKSNHLTYWLAAGTLLGAVRHRGFIPWDDDADIMMPRNDYNRLIQFKSINSNIDIVSVINDNGYYHPFSFCKISDKETVSVIKGSDRNTGRGQFLDVFPLDNIPDDKTSETLFLNKMHILHAIENRAVGKYRKERSIKACLRNVITFILRPFSKQFFMRFIDKQAQKYNKSNTARWGWVVFNTGSKFQWDKKDFAHTCRIPFEGELFCVPDGVENILKHQYGDYMELPPIDQRVAKHDMIIHWKNT